MHRDGTVGFDAEAHVGNGDWVAVRGEFFADDVGPALPDGGVLEVLAEGGVLNHLLDDVAQSLETIPLQAVLLASANSPLRVQTPPDPPRRRPL